MSSSGVPMSSGALEEKTVTTEIDDEGKTDEYIETVENIGMPPVETRLSKEVTGTLVLKHLL
jgi:hypothetical protein